MKKFPVQITQVGQFEQTCTILVEAEDMRSAMEAVAVGAIDPPANDSVVWNRELDLHHSRIVPGQKNLRVGKH